MQCQMQFFFPTISLDILN